MKLSSLPIAVRISFSVAMPVIVLCICASLYILDHFSSARKMERVQHITELSHSVSLFVHELQKERGRSAGYLGAKGQGEAAVLLNSQYPVTDEAMSKFEGSIEEHLVAIDDQLLSKMYWDMEHELKVVLDHRTGVQNFKYSLPETVGPYTRTIAKLIGLAAEATKAASGSHSVGDLSAFIALMNAKENAGIERAIGSNAFAKGVVTENSHKKVLNIVSRQEAFLQQFRMLMSPEWGAKLDEYKQKTDWKSVVEARKILIDTAYDQSANKIAQYTGPEWFALTSKRIELLMELEQNLGDEIDAEAYNLGRHYQQNAYFILISCIACVIGTIIFSIIMVISVVKPINRVSHQLGLLVDGQTEIEVSGTDRKDEIGVLSRAAKAFREASRERQRMEREKAERETAELAERRETLSIMADEVKTASGKSVEVVSRAADSLLQGSRGMTERMTVAKENARVVNESAQATMDSTEQAASLAGELNSAIAEVAENIVRGDTIVRNAVELADESRGNVSDLDKAAQQIGDFVGIIAELAEQTNLLALNATIESARAGEAGKGFSVVAEEIKQLANQTNRSASQISERVNQIQSQTHTAVNSIGAITKSVEDIGDVTASVAAAIEEQRSSTESFTQFLHENGNALRGVANGVNDLSEIAIEGAQSAEQIGLLAEEMAAQSKEVSETIPQIVDKAIVAAERRGAKRVKVEQSFQVKDGDVLSPAMLSDVSLTGAHVKAHISGTAIELIVVGISSPIKAKVVWNNNGQAGVQFRQELTAGQFDRICQLNTTEQAA